MKRLKPKKRSVRQGVQKRRRRRKRRRLHQLGRLLVACQLAYGLHWLWSSPVWAWQGQTEVRGNRLVSGEAILERLALPEQVPLYRIDPARVAEQVGTLPAIARVAVHRWLFPARLELVVVERQPLLGVVGRPLWLDQEGVFFEAPEALARPAFALRLRTAAKAGERLTPGLREGLFEALAAWPKGGRGTLDLRKESDIRAEVDGWPVRFGGLEGLGNKLALLEHLKPLAERYRERLQYIDMRFTESPSFKLKSGRVRPEGSPP